MNPDRYMVESVVNREVLATFGGSSYKLTSYTFDPINGKFSKFIQSIDLQFLNVYKVKFCYD